MLQVARTYSHAAKMRPVRDAEGNAVVGENGRARQELEPGSPTRLANERDWNFWWEDEDAGGEVIQRIAARCGLAIVREV
jgi:hypothetical protein